MTRFRLSTSFRACRWAPLALAAALLAGCKGTDTSSAGSGDVGGTMVIALPGDVGTLMPLLVASQADREITDLLFDRLAEIGDEMSTIGDKGFTPRLAESWQWAPDSLSIAFRLHPKAKWHDGRPVRASDVRYSVALVKDPAFGAPASPMIGNIDSVSVKDSVTAVAWFKKHTPEQFYDLVYQVVIVPEHILGNTPAAQLKSADVARRGIGSGRFRLAAWQPGQRIELIADTANYRGRARLDRVVYAVSPDFNAAAARFFSGEADMFEQLRPEQIAKVQGDSQRRLVRYPSFQYAYLAFNLVDPKQTSQPHPIFADRAVRRALTMAVDRRAMLTNVFGTLANPLYGPFPSSVAVADTGLPQIPYDTAKARALLDSAGWTVGADGVRTKGGRRLEFGISTPNSSATRHQYAVLLQEAFRRVGASARLDETDFAAYAAKQGTHGFDTEIAVYVTDPSPSGFKQSWTSAGIAKDGSNFPSYSNPVVDALLDSAAAAFDPARTRSHARRAFEIIIDDAPGIWLYQPPTVAGLHRRIRTATMRPDGYWSHLADWWIPAGERSARDQIGLRAAQ
ncbi:MAG TPA: peptide ABC transporter substrate-binding protein [Gemmatimonadaceae bacterium]|nr:peptide ABC transporter substrate-binding protein [Gemmatimonadaceae bacterium]